MQVPTLTELTADILMLLSNYFQDSQRSITCSKWLLEQPPRRRECREARRQLVGAAGKGQCVGGAHMAAQLLCSLALWSFSEATLTVNLIRRLIFEQFQQNLTLQHAARDTSNDLSSGMWQPNVLVRVWSSARARDASVIFDSCRLCYAKFKRCSGNLQNLAR